MNGKSLGSEGDYPEHRRRLKTVKISEIEPETNDQRAASYGTVGLDDLPVQRRWVPPQPPPVAIPEAAAAIRQPKPTRKERPGDEPEQSKHTDDGTVEMPRITNAPESEIEVESPDGVADLIPSESREEQDDSIEVN